MDPFDYRVRDKSRYLSSGITPGNSKKPVAKGSTTSFTHPHTALIESGSIQFIMEPAEDDVLCATFRWRELTHFGGLYYNWYHDPYFLTEIYELIEIRYLQNGVYSILYKGESIRVVSRTGPVAMKLVFMPSEVFISIDGATVRLSASNPPIVIESEIAPSGGVLYDKILRNNDELSVEELVEKKPKPVAGSRGHYTPIVRDKLYAPVVISADDMEVVDGYSVYARSAAITNTSAAFLSDTTQIEKSTDAETWHPVDKVEYHGHNRPIFRSDDPDFTIELFNTTMTDFIAKGLTTTTTGEVYKVGENIGSYFSHDCYRVVGGSFKAESEGMESFTLLGYIPDEVVSELDPVIDYDGDNYGKLHLYTFQAEDEFEIVADEIFIAGIGKNLEHNGLMDILVGRPEISYADEIEDIQIGMSANGDSEYAILDLQWGL